MYTFETKEAIIKEIDELKRILKSLTLDRRIRKVYEEELEELNYKLCMMEQGNV